MTLTILKKKIHLFDLLFTLLAFTLPLSFALPNILLLLVFVLFLIQKKKEKMNTYVKLVIVFVAYLIIKAILNKTLIDSFNTYKHLIAFAGISAIVFQIKNRNLVKTGFVLGVLTAVIITVSKIIVYYLRFDTIPLGNTSEIIDLLLLHRPYFGFVCLLGIMCSTTLIDTSKNIKQKLFYKITIAIFIGFVYLIVARLALGLTLIYLFIIILQRYKLSKKKIVLFGSIFISITLLLIVNNKNLKKRLHIEDSIDQTVKVLANQEPRVVIWKCFFWLINKGQFNTLTGYNEITEIQKDLNNCYKETIENVSKNRYYLVTKFNTHNQFFDFFLQGGIVGLLLFMLIFGYLFFHNKLHLMNLFLVFSFVSFLILENLFHRQLGVYLIGIFIPLFMKSNYEKSAKN